MTVIKLTLSSDLPVDLNNQDGVRRFAGIATSGRPFGYGDYRLAVDLADIAYKAQTAVLLEHDPHRAVGVCALSVGADGLKAEGTLLDNEHGREVAAAADQGFPWEMSAYIQAQSVERLSAGQSLTLNGREVTGPLEIMRRCTVREVSFCAVGADGNTQAVMLSDGSPYQPQQQTTESSMTEDEKKAFDDLKAEVETLRQEKAAAQTAAHRAQVEAKLSAAGFVKQADGAYQGLSAAAVQVLLSAKAEDVDVLIADFGGGRAKAAIPPDLLTGGEAARQSENDVKLSVAEAKGSLGGSYV
ncbi:MAG: hypothetical protein Q3966_09905 [Neisseria sp.]|nr:hypothetical protein [Neisseria sp.]